MSDNINARDNINALRFLSADAIEKAGSGHPGMPLGMAEIATVLWQDYLKHSPNHPAWLDRDRFVLSNGHGSMLLYALLHLSGYDLSLTELKNFRQYQSKTPGHPELGHTPGVEITSGPLAQGIGAAVGMALAEKLLAQEFNRPGFEVIDHYSYVFLGDGCLMEGLSHEVCSLAGLWRLGKLICFYDANQISIDGNTDGWFKDDTARRFAGYNWQVIGPIDGHSPAKIKEAILKARAEKELPSLIICQTNIGQGSPNKVGTAECHGSPLGKDEVAAMRQKLNWPHSAFEVPKAVRQNWDARPKGEERFSAWQNLFLDYQAAHPDLAKELSRRSELKLPDNWDQTTQAMSAKVAKDFPAAATRQSSQQVLQLLAAQLPELLGGSADLTPSNLTKWPQAESFSFPFKQGRYLHYGVREFGMAAILNGLAAHRGFLVFGGTFLAFSDYCRPAIRLSALMRQRVIYVFTHDSIGLGEDGPTHQPIEHAAALRAIPNLDVWRPADALETLFAWLKAVSNFETPTALLLSRQKLPLIEREQAAVENISRGGYVLKAALRKPQLVLLATGSEVHLACQAQEKLQELNIDTQLVSMPSSFVFDRQSEGYRQHVLPVGVPVLALEAGSSSHWHKYIGASGKVLGIDDFGLSAPAKVLFDHFGFNLDKLLDLAKSLTQ